MNSIHDMEESLTRVSFPFAFARCLENLDDNGVIHLVVTAEGSYQETAEMEEVSGDSPHF